METRSTDLPYTDHAKINSYFLDEKPKRCWLSRICCCIKDNQEQKIPRRRIDSFASLFGDDECQRYLGTASKSTDAVQQYFDPEEGVREGALTPRSFQVVDSLLAQATKDAECVD